MPEYTVAAVASVVAVLAYERWWARSGLLRRPAWWIALAICAGFMVLVDGWLTKLSAPIVEYDPDQRLALRVPWDIPVEDYLFGFALLTLVGIRWVVAGRRLGDRREPDERGEPVGRHEGTAAGGRR